MLRKAIFFAGLLTMYYSSVNAQTLIRSYNSISSFARIGNELFYAADDGVHGLELWKTDGTPGGTTMVKDIYPGYYSSGVSSITSFNGKIYFVAYDGINGNEVWQSDGTAQGTKMLKDIFPGSGSSQTAHFTIFNGALYFTATTDGGYFSLWKTDGTTAGTNSIVLPGNYTSLSQLTVVGNSLYFVGGYGDLFQSDGTTAGTHQIKVDDFTVIDLLHNVNNKLVFITSYTLEHYNIRLYQLDPADTTATLLHAYQAVTYGSNDIANITAAGTGFYFTIHTTDINSNDQDALWRSDGTAAGTTMIKSFSWQSHISGSSMTDFIWFGNKLYFSATNDNSLSTTDGTASGTVQVNPVAMAAGTPVVSGQKFFFTDIYGKLWSFNGSKAVAEVTMVPWTTNLFDDNGTLYFTSKNSTTNQMQLWNNVPAGQLQVTMGYTALSNGGTSNFNSKTDSAVTSVVNLKNTGNKELVFSGISIAGASFYVNGTLSRTLLPGQQANFNLVYFPAKQGQDQAVLQIKSTDNSGQEEFIQNLSGTAAGKAADSKPTGGLGKSITFQDSISTFALSQDTVVENVPLGSVIGSFAVTGKSGYQFALINGLGDTDNGSFSVQNGQLTSATTFNYNTKGTYSIRARAVAGTDTLTKNFTISIANVQTQSTGTCGPSFQSLNFALYDAVYNGSRIIASGSAGTVLVSDDDGQHWKKVPIGISNRMSRIQFTDAKTGYMVGDGGTLFKTENNGDSWFPLISPANPYPGITGLSFSSSSVGYIFGGGSIYKTANGGRNWQKLAYSSYNTLNEAAFIDSNNGFICGTSQTLIHTTDGGKTWQNVTLTVLGQSTNLNHILFVDSKTGFITSSVGDVLKTTDGGANWSRVGTAATDYVNRIYFTDQNNGYLLTGFNSPVLYKTADGGATWTPETVNIGGTFTGLAINKTGDKLCMVGLGTGSGSTSDNPGSTIILKNGSGPWVVRSSIANYDYVDGNLFASGTGYLFGGQNLKTTDGGITWKDMNIVPDYYEPVTHGYFINADTGFYSTYRRFYRTTNGGTTWTRLNIDSTLLIERIFFSDAKTGFLVNTQHVYKTTDGGNTWASTLDGNFESSFFSMKFVNAQTGFAVGSYSYFYKTTDGGNTWTSKDFGSPDNFLTSVYFLDEQTGFIGGSNGQLLRTTDGGTTWNPVVTTMTQITYGFQFTDKQHGYLLNKYPGGNSQIYETFDAGLTWNQIYQPYDEIKGFSMNDGPLFVTGTGGSVIKLNPAGPAPANAGYILGDTTIAARNQLLYSVATTPGTNYKWSFTGPATAEYYGNSLYISWKQAGQYTLQVTPYNNCGTGEIRTVQIEVKDMPDPKLTGPDSTFSHAHVSYTTSPAPSTETVNWAVAGGAITSSSGNNAIVNWGNPGNGTVSVVATDTVLNMKKSADLSVIIQKNNILPANNFDVSVTGCTCKGSNNGIIQVTAAQSMSYSLQVTGPGGFNKTFSFTDSLRVGDLIPGAYNACISLSSDTGFHRCYDLNVTEPKDLSLYSSIESSTGMMTLDLSGADSYHVELNDVPYTTTANQVRLQLNSGANKLKIYSDKLCQGVIEKIVNFHKITLYPDPFTDHVSIDLGGSPERTINVKVSTVSGKVIYNQDQTNQSGTLQVNLPGLMTGSYVLTLTLGRTQSVFKIIKQ